MRIAKVTARTKDVEGGEIVRDANGNPTGMSEEQGKGKVIPFFNFFNFFWIGIFKDRAMDLINAVVPPLSADEEDR